MENDNYRSTQEDDLDENITRLSNIMVYSYTDSSGQLQTNRIIEYNGHRVSENSDPERFYRLLGASQALTRRMNSLTQNHKDRINSR